MKNTEQKSLPYYTASLSVIAMVCLWMAYHFLGVATTLYKQQRLEQYLGVTKTTALQFQNELRSRINLLQLCASRPEMKRLILRGQWGAALDLTQNTLAAGGIYESFQLFNPAGRLMAQRPPEQPGTASTKDNSMLRARSFLKTTGTSISNSKVERRTDQPNAWFFFETVPITDSQGTRLGTLVTQVSVLHMINQIKTFSPGFAGETYLVNKDGQNLSEVDPQAVDLQLRQIVRHADVGSLEYHDTRRGTSFLTTFMRIPQIGACLVREISVHDALQEWRLIVIVLGSLALLTIIITAQFFWSWNDLLKKQDIQNKVQEIEHLKSEFFAVASHELRTPLTSLREGISLLMGEPPENLSEIQQSLIAILDCNIKRLCNLVNDIVDIAVLEAGKTLFRKDSVDARALLTGAVDSVRAQAETKNISLNISAEVMPPVFGDALRLHQVLTSLLHNSIKHTPINGRIDISAETQGASVEFCVADTGEGIDRNTLKHALEKLGHLSSSREEGTLTSQLSLAVCQKIVDSHKGKLRLESKPGEGTRALFTVPKLTTSLWWTEIWNELRSQNPPCGIGLIGVLIAPRLSTTISIFESQIRACVKKQDYVLRDSEAGIVWVMACAQKMDVEKIVGRIESKLESTIDENQMRQQVHFHTSFDHASTELVKDPAALVIQLTKKLEQKTPAA